MSREHGQQEECRERKEQGRKQRGCGSGVGTSRGRGERWGACGGGSVGAQGQRRGALSAKGVAGRCGKGQAHVGVANDSRSAVRAEMGRRWKESAAVKSAALRGRGIAGGCRPAAQRAVEAGRSVEEGGALRGAFIAEGGQLIREGCVIWRLVGVGRAGAVPWAQGWRGGGR